MISPLLLCFSVLLHTATLHPATDDLAQSHTAQHLADDPGKAKKPWIFIKHGGADLPIELEIMGKEQIVAQHLGAFYGIADSEKSIYFNLGKGIVINTSAVFGTRIIKTPRHAMAVNSAIHFKNGSRYYFRTSQSNAPRAWENLNENNLDGTVEITPGTSHIDGYVSYDGAGTFTFPLGNGKDQYRPLTCVGNNGQVITASWLPGDPTNPIDPTDANAAHNRNAMLNGLKQVYAAGQWDWHVRNAETNVTGTTNPANIQPAAPVRITVNIPTDVQQLTGGAMANLALAGWNGTAWEPLQSSQVASGTISAIVNKSFSAISYGRVDGGSLPVKLISFSARPEGATTFLKWATSSESNSGHFDIQHSADGKGWNQIGRIKAAGESNEAIDYTFSDSKPLAGDNFYRLKMVDADSTFAYSRIERVNFAATEEFTFFPNPASSTISISTHHDWSEIKSVKMFDITGRQVQTSRSKSIDVTRIVPGIYTLQVEGPKNYIISRNIIIER